MMFAMLLGSTTSLLAQSENSYLMLNFNLNNQHRYNNPYPNSKGASTLGIQWIKNRKNNQAFRFGLSGYNQYEHNFVSLRTSNDTSFYNYKSYSINMPKLSFGMEFQKRLHKDVMLYIGADAQVGASKARAMSYEEVYTHNGLYSSYRGNSDERNDAFAFGATLKPFVGLRANWSRFVFSYELSMPMNFTKIRSSANFDMGQLQHTISLGYMFGKKK
jgi:hypothetical protein